MFAILLQKQFCIQPLSFLFFLFSQFSEEAITLAQVRGDKVLTSRVKSFCHHDFLPKVYVLWSFLCNREISCSPDICIVPCVSLTPLRWAWGHMTMYWDMERQAEMMYYFWAEGLKSCWPILFLFHPFGGNRGDHILREQRNKKRWVGAFNTYTFRDLRLNLGQRTNQGVDL